MPPYKKFFNFLPLEALLTLATISLQPLNDLIAAVDHAYTFAKYEWFPARTTNTTRDGLFQLYMSSNAEGELGLAIRRALLEKSVLPGTLEVLLSAFSWRIALLLEKAAVGELLSLKYKYCFLHRRLTNMPTYRAQ